MTVAFRVKPIRYYGGSGFVIEIKDKGGSWLPMGNSTSIFIYSSEEDARNKLTKAVEITDYLPTK